MYIIYNCFIQQLLSIKMPFSTIAFLTIDMQCRGTPQVASLDGVLCHVLFVHVFDDQCVTGSYTLHTVLLAGDNLTGSFVPCDWHILFVQFTCEVAL